MNILGCDPGINGGFAYVSDGEIIETLRTPKIGNELDIKSIANFIDKYDVDLVVVEDVHAIYGSSATSTFNFGRNLGIIEGVIVGLGLPYEKVTPKVWQKKSWKGVEKVKKAKGNGTDTKATSLKAFMSIYPEDFYLTLPTTRCSVAHDGIVDAVLIARSKE